MSLNKFPIYIPSKGRWGRPLTARSLEMMGVKYKMIVEEQEFAEYSKVIDKSNLLILDKMYKDKYELCDDKGLNISTGSGPARNFAWEHSIAQGHKWHWCIDDNIRYFLYYNDNTKHHAVSSRYFKEMERFVLLYKNVAMAGPEYGTFVTRKSKYNHPFRTNKRIFSCNLIRNDIPFRWRGRYNEDAILSLDILKAGWCTILFKAFLQQKMATQSMKGGNTDEIYRFGTQDKSRMLKRVHPLHVKLRVLYGRKHHKLDYSQFKHLKLVKKNAPKGA